MFYQELYRFCNEQSNSPIVELIESIDFWLATLPENQQDKITIGKIANKFNIDYNISRGLLEKLTQLKILERIFAIKCPNCGLVLKTSNEENLYADMIEVKNHINCYNCEEKILNLSSTNIEIRYKLIKKPDNDPDKIKLDIYNALDLNNEVYRNDNLKDLIDKGYDSNKLFYKPTKKEYEKLDILLRGVFDAHSTAEKGNTLEEFVEYLLNLIKPIKATKDAKTNTNQLDCFALNNCDISNNALKIMGHTFICECKNECRTPANGYFHKLANILNVSRKDNTEHKFGIIFSKKAPPSTYLQMAYKNYYMTNTTIITFFEEELKEIVYDKKNLLGYIDYKINLVQQDLKPNQETKNIFI
ncbi:hypothetical protein [Clostridium botulinum]|uniref:hypothetical protein n=1 Tax=Clostridium botulinum TaxID=1491 RepID=UPI000774E6A3|nr:hypothetical protein [Clostridium botulinum]MBY6931011.1 hypothetical protein [Clostridium botulinum]NFG19917.1 hypothetical protein [Clostridium botulinum]NFO82219.1 hypothetical protein [Clostridium botulinum]